MSDESEFFNSIDEVLSSLKSEGFRPVIRDRSVGESTCSEYIEIDLYCKHGHSSETRTYCTLPDGRLEWLECSYDAEPCLLCSTE